MSCAPEKACFTLGMLNEPTEMSLSAVSAYTRMRVECIGRSWKQR